MSKRAEQKALEAYRKEIRDDTGFVIDIGYPQYIRDYFIEGYEQAEKDLALTAEDVQAIFNKVRDLQFQYCATEGCYQEVADWFNEQRNAKK